MGRAVESARRPRVCWHCCKAQRASRSFAPRVEIPRPAPSRFLVASTSPALASFLELHRAMVIDTSTFNDIARHLYGVSEGLLDGMRKVVALNPDLPADDHQKLRAEWLQAVEAFVRVNSEVLTLAELLRALLAANDAARQSKPALS